MWLAVLGLLKKFWEPIAGLAVAGFSILAAIFVKRGADEKVAKQQSVDSELNTAAEKTAMNNLENTIAAQTDAKAIPDDQLAAEADAEGISRK